MPTPEELNQEIIDAIEETVEDALPDVQKVEVMNPPESPEVQKVEITNQPEPPQKIDLSGLEKAFKELANRKREVTPPTDMAKVESLLNGIMSKLKEPTDNSEVLSKILKAIDSSKPLPVDLTELSGEMRQLVGEINKISEKPSPSFRGGGIGPSKVATKNIRGVVVDPAIAVREGDKLDILGIIDPQATPIAGLDAKSKFRIPGITGVKNNELKTQDSLSYLLKEILMELKINNKHLELLTEVEFEDLNIEE